jgi:hypothetical protein
MLLNDHLNMERCFEIDQIARNLDWLGLFSSGFCAYTVKICAEDSRTLSCGDVDRIINYLLFELNAQFSVPVLERTSRGKSNLNPIAEFVFLPPPESFSIDLASSFKVAEDPLESFQIALLTEDPAYRFLCFYHVAEFFFEEVREEKLKNQVRKILGEHQDTVNDHKIKALVEMMKKTGRTDEVQALEEVLVTYKVSAHALKARLGATNECLVFYENNDLFFSKRRTTSLSFGELDNRTFCKTLAKRIYDCRCHLVHRKKSDNGGYRPLRKSREVVKELNLIQATAEIILRNSSRASTQESADPVPSS